MIRHEMGIVRLPVILLILYGTRNHIHTFRHFPVGIENADELKSLAMASAIDATSKASVQLAMDVIENGATASAHSKARGFAPLALTKTIQSAPVPTHDVGSNVATRFTLALAQWIAAQGWGFDGLHRNICNPFSGFGRPLLAAVGEWRRPKDGWWKRRSCLCRIRSMGMLVEDARHDAPQ